MRSGFLLFLPLAAIPAIGAFACSALPACDADGTCLGGTASDSGAPQDGSATVIADGGSDVWQCCTDAAASDADGAATSPDATPPVDDGGQTACGDASFCGPDAGCVNTSTSVEHCGLCSISCSAPSGHGSATCSQGTCGVICDPGYEACGGQCYSVDDIDHCGGCSNICAGPTNGDGTPTCVDAGCAFTCNAGYHVCGKQCLPNNDPPSADPCVVSAAFGVFVSPTGSDTSGNGTEGSPFATVTKAATVAISTGLSSVFACGGTYPTALNLGSSVDGVKVYGGLDCGTWTYSAAAIAKIAPNNAGPALLLHDLTTGVTFADFAFDVTNASGNSATSTAVLVANAANVLFERVTMTAGNATNAAPATTGSNYTGAAPTGSGPSGSTGGGGGVASCTYGQSVGGSGGQGVAGQSGSGSPGTSTPTATTSPGFDGAGGPAGTTVCTGGDPGANGAAPTAATGATAWGTLTASGWTPMGGGPGQPGNPGEGGGGGGGVSLLSTGGAGGGAGGCGGAGGPGGSGGGSSFGLLSYQSFVQLQACTISTGNAGSGANGAPGQSGQGGGGAGTNGTCAGGVGGNGSGGGAGGGGAGGLSAPVAYVGTAPSYSASGTTASTLTPKNPGTAGTGVSTGALGGTNAFGPGASGPTSTGGLAGQSSATPVNL